MCDISFELYFFSIYIYIYIYKYGPFIQKKVLYAVLFYTIFSLLVEQPHFIFFSSYLHIAVFTNIFCFGLSLTQFKFFSFPGKWKLFKHTNIASMKKKNISKIKTNVPNSLFWSVIKVYSVR